MRLLIALVTLAALANPTIGQEIDWSTLDLANTVAQISVRLAEINAPLDNEMMTKELFSQTLDTAIGQVIELRNAMAGNRWVEISSFSTTLGRPIVSVEFRFKDDEISSN